MTIGQIIKKLRRERDITQEQLAEYLGLTASAISQWETDRVLPDVTQIPVLANVFEVSTEVIFGVDIENKDKEIEKIIENAMRYADKGYHKEAETVLREGIKIYPSSHNLLELLMHMIWRNWDEKDTPVAEEIVNIGTKLLSESTNNTIREGATQILCFTYPKIGKRDEALKLAKSTTALCVCREMLLSSIYEGTEKYRFIQHLITELLTDIQNRLPNNQSLDDGSKPYTANELIKIHLKSIELVKIFTVDNNYGFFTQHIAWTYLEIAEIYAEMKDKLNTLLYLSMAKDMATVSDTDYEPDKTYTSLILRGNRFGNVSHNITDNESLHQLKIMRNEQFDFIRDCSEFTKIENCLKGTALKH